PLFYDYRCFNNEILAEYIKWLSEDVKKYYPELKVHTKIMDYYNFAWERFILNGSDYEIMSDYTDLNGCDAFSTYPYTSYNYTKAPLELKMGWYDYMTSIKEAPVWDTESHISNDYPIPEYDDLVPYYTSADVWNGAIHGRGAQIIWLWDLRRGSLPGSWSNYPNANAVMRPADVVQVSKTALDLNRLSEEVTALQKQKPEVGLLWSKTSIGYSDTYMKANSDAYKQIIYSGQKVGFVTETKPEDMHKYKLIVIPEATHLPDNVMSELEKYEGEILIQNNNSLEYNEYNKPYDTKRISAIYSRADVTDDIRGKISEMNLSEVVLIDADTGEKCNEIEWTYTKYNNKYLVNILNYNNKDTKKIEVFVGNRKVQSMTELRSDEMVENGILSIEPYKPQLIEFNISTFDIIDEKGNVIKEDIGKLENGIIRYNI
ncbi:MAG: hypothetical protein U0M60_07040, partial [Clostridia bacterium]|nr:hypothetical protein [Clostridia bacterium]